MSKLKFQVEDIKHHAKGLWADTIFPRFGIHVQFKKKTPCPACGGKDRFRYDDKNGVGDYFCQQCGFGDGISLIEKKTGMKFSEILAEIASIVGLEAESIITEEMREQWRKESEFRIKKQAEIEKKRQLQIARKAQGLWRGAYKGKVSLYLKEKQVDIDPRIKIDHNGNVLIPAYDIDNFMWNLQTIESNGKKYFVMGDENIDTGLYEAGGGRSGGCFFMIGEVQLDLYDGHLIGTAEGYATGMSIHMASGIPIALTFVANNQQKVAAELKKKYPNARFIHFTDDDSAKENTGLKYAQEAQAITGGVIVLPDFSHIHEAKIA